MVIITPFLLLSAVFVYIFAENESCFSTTQNLPQLVKNAKRVIVFAPAKCGGSSMLLFTKMCVGAANVVTGAQLQLRRGTLLNRPTAPPKLISNHIGNGETLAKFINMAGYDSLIIFISREEGSRLKSAINQVVAEMCSEDSKNHMPFVKKTNHRTEKNNCTIVEVKSFIEKILVPQKFEIGYSIPQMLSCHVQNAIKSTAANFVMIDYTMLDELQAVLARDLCPQLIPSLPVHANSASMHSVQYIRQKNGSDADELLNDWIDSRADLLGWALGYPYPGCNSQFLRLQRDLQTCKTKAMRVNDLSYIGDMEENGWK